MASRKTSTASSIDSIAVIAIALKRVKTKAEYNRVAAVNTQADLEVAWARLSAEDQKRIHELCSEIPEPGLQVIALALSSCGTLLLELQAVKAEHGSDVNKQSWKLPPSAERDRLTNICKNEPQPQPVEEPKPAKRSLYAISHDICDQSADELEAKLDATDDPEEQATLIELWLQESAGLRDEMNERGSTPTSTSSSGRRRWQSTEQVKVSAYGN